MWAPEVDLEVVGLPFEEGFYHRFKYCASMFYSCTTVGATSNFGPLPSEGGTT